MRGIECILFDLDGVLTDTAKYHCAAWKKLADEMGIYFDRDINERLKGISRMQSLDIILENSNESYSVEEKERLAQIKNDYYRDYINHITPNNLFKGVKRLLEDIKRLQIKIVLASASKNANYIIDRLGIERYFDWIIDVSKIKRGKPDPEIFLTGAQQVGVLPQYCVVVEDSYAGITGAKSAGMLTVGIGSKDILYNADIIYAETGDMNIDDLKELYITSDGQCIVP